MTEYEKDYFVGGVYKDPHYFDFPAHEIRVVKLIDLLHPYSVLDVGCAYGYIVKHFMERGVNAWGCDVSHWCEQQAKEIIPDRFVLAPAWDLSFFRDKSFDVIYCEGVLEHIPEDKIGLTFKEFQRVGKRFYLQIALSNIPGFDGELGHVCKHDQNWWVEKIPSHSWLAPIATQDNNVWIYKG